MPADVQRTIDGSSSKSADRLTIGPPAAGIVAMRRFVKKNLGLAIEVSNAMRVPSGDHCGLLSGPSCGHERARGAVGHGHDGDVG